jgi:hypothetical protein
MCNLLIKFKTINIVILFTIMYWIFALTARFYPEIFMTQGSLRFIHVKFIVVSIILNIINIVLSSLMLYYKVGKLKCVLILLVINIITAVVGICFTSFPIRLM